MIFKDVKKFQFSWKISVWISGLYNKKRDIELKQTGNAG